MIERTIAQTIKIKAAGFPIISLLGARQTGKTTLVKSLFPKYQYVNLENPDVRSIAETDPRGFFAKYRQHVIIDEAQRVPELFSYLQTIVDEDKIENQFVLTGSQHFLLLHNIPQSLAGRMAIFNLNPLSNQEVSSSGKKVDLSQQLIAGYYPVFYNQTIDRSTWFSGYLQTYLERDIRLAANITNLSIFERFIRLLAARTGTILNLLSIANELDISHNTIKSWVNLLEVSGIIYLVQPYFANIGKRLVKTPKVYFTDVGFAAWLIGIQDTSQIELHPLKGALFETLIMSELKKHLNNHALPWKMYFYRDHNGLEADVILDQGLSKTLIEIKANQTVNINFLNNLPNISKLLSFENSTNLVVYGGDELHQTSTGKFVSWQSIPDALPF